ncbi:hypothetical protein QJQ45_021454, partial [Haematococcus lacustris]
ALGGWGDGDADAGAEGEEADTWSDSGCVGIEPGIPAGTGQWGDHTSHHPAAPTRHPTSPPPGHATATAAVQRLRAQQQQQQQEGQQHEWQQQQEGQQHEWQQQQQQEGQEHEWQQQQQEEGQQQQEAQQQQQATPPPPPIGARVLQGSGQGQEEGLDLDADVGVLLGTCDPHRLRSTSFTATHASPCPLPGFDPCPSSTPPPRHQEGHPRVAHLPAATAASPGPGQPADPATPLTSPLASVFAHASAPPHAWTSSRVRHQAQPAPPAPWSPPPPSAEQHRHTDGSQMPGRPPPHPTPGFEAAHRLASPQAEQLAGQAGALFDSLRQLHQLMSGPQAARLSPRCTQTGEGSGLDLAGGWAPPPAPTPLATGSRPKQQEEEEEEVDGEEGVAAAQAGGGGRRGGGWRETSSPTLWAHSPPALDPPCQGLSPQPSRGWLGRPSTLAQEQDAEDVEDIPDEQGRAAGSAAAAAVEGEEGEEEEEEEEGVARQHHAPPTRSSPSPMPGSSSSSGIPGVGAPSGAAGCSVAVWGGGGPARHPAAGTVPQAQSSGAGAAGGMPGLSPRHVLVPQDVAWMASLMATLSHSLSDGQLMDGRLGGSASGSGQQVQGQGQAVKVVIAERRQVIKAALRGLVEAAQPDLSPSEVDAVVAEVNKRMTMGSKQCVLAAVMSLTVLLLSFLGQPTPGFPAAAGPAPGPPPPPDPDHPPYAHPRIPTRISPRTAAAPAQLPPPVQLGIWDPQLLAQIRDAMELITKASVQEHLMRGPHHHGIRLLPGEVAAFEQPSSAWPVAMLQQLDEEHLTGDGNSLNANATTIITSILEFYRHPGRFIRWWCKAVGVVEEGFTQAPPPPPPAQAPPAQAPPPPPPAQAQPLPAAPGPAPPPQAPPWGRWLDRDTNGCLNLQRIGESRQRPLELCQWDDLEALPPIGKEYQQRYKRVNDRLPKGRQWLHRAAEYRRGIDGRARNNA